MPTAYCNLNDAYGDWDYSNDPSSFFKKGARNQVQNQARNHEESSSEEPNYPLAPITPAPHVPTANSVCPSCNTCLAANNKFQQQVLNQTIGPRPQWIPQNNYYNNQYDPVPYMTHDPFNRYWTQRDNWIQRENFGNVEFLGSPGSVNIDTKILIKILLVILITMFIVQLMECTKE
jgi:hypothetical protein